MIPPDRWRTEQPQPKHNHNTTKTKLQQNQNKTTTQVGISRLIIIIGSEMNFKIEIKMRLWPEQFETEILVLREIPESHFLADCAR